MSVRYAEDLDTASDVAEVTTIGVAVRAAPQPGMVVGFNRDVLMSVPNDACVDLNRPGPCAAGAAKPAASPASKRKEEP